MLFGTCLLDSISVIDHIRQGWEFVGTSTYFSLI